MQTAEKAWQRSLNSEIASHDRLAAERAGAAARAPVVRRDQQVPVEAARRSEAVAGAAPSRPADRVGPGPQALDPTARGPQADRGSPGTVVTGFAQAESWIEAIYADHQRVHRGPDGWTVHAKGRPPVALRFGPRVHDYAEIRLTKIEKIQSLEIERLRAWMKTHEPAIETTPAGRFEPVFDGAHQAMRTLYARWGHLDEIQKPMAERATSASRSPVPAPETSIVDMEKQREIAWYRAQGRGR